MTPVVPLAAILALLYVRRVGSPSLGDASVLREKLSEAQAEVRLLKNALLAMCHQNGEDGSSRR